MNRWLVVLFVAAAVLMSSAAALRSSGGGGCSWTCPRGLQAIANPKHVPSSNGCGNSVVKVKANSAWSFEPCCNGHDICFDTCGQKKEDCDSQFGTCMESVCENLPAAERKQCGSQAQMFLMGGSVFGCNSYMESQKNACLCVGHDEL